MDMSNRPLIRRCRMTWYVTDDRQMREWWRGKSLQVSPSHLCTITMASATASASMDTKSDSKLSAPQPPPSANASTWLKSRSIVNSSQCPSMIPASEKPILTFHPTYDDTKSVFISVNNPDWTHVKLKAQATRIIWEKFISESKLTKSKFNPSWIWVTKQFDPKVSKSTEGFAVKFNDTATAKSLIDTIVSLKLPIITAKYYQAFMDVGVVNGISPDLMNEHVQLIFKHTPNVVWQRAIFKDTMLNKPYIMFAVPRAHITEVKQFDSPSLEPLRRKLLKRSRNRYCGVCADRRHTTRTCPLYKQ